MTRSIQLLIIDDNTEVLESLEKYFLKKGFQVTSASNGLDAVKILEEENRHFDLIITDLIMPNISGLGLISISKRKYPDLPVIAITGWGEHPETLATEAHADVVLEKPFELSKLDRYITELISSRTNKAV